MSNLKWCTVWSDNHIQLLSSEFNLTSGEAGVAVPSVMTLVSGFLTLGDM